MDDLPKALKAIRNAIVDIEVISFDHPEASFATGSGFAVSSDGYVVTAAHVINNSDDVLRRMKGVAKVIQANVRLKFPQGRGKKPSVDYVPVDFTVVEVDKKFDLALLKLRLDYLAAGSEYGPPRVASTARLSSAQPDEGAQVAVSGFPHGGPILVTSEGILAAVVRRTPGMAIPFKHPAYGKLGNPDYAGDIYMASIDVAPGDSGAPVYLVRSAAVLGMCVGGYPEPVLDQDDKGVTLPGDRALFSSSHMGAVVPAPYIIQMLRAHNVTFSYR